MELRTDARQHDRAEDAAGNAAWRRVCWAPAGVFALLFAGLLTAGCGLEIEPVPDRQTPGETSSNAPATRPESPREAGAPVEPETPTPPIPPPPIPRQSPPGRVDLTVFGQQAYGLHPEMAARLRRAEALLAEEMKTWDPAAEEGDWEIRTIAGYRPGSRGHAAGLAVDINYFRNPYIMHERGEAELDRQLGPVYHRIARMMLGRDSVIPEAITQGAIGPERTLRLYGELREESLAMVRYFQLMRDREALAKHLDAMQDPVRSLFWNGFLPDGSTPTPQAVQRQMMRDYVTLAGRPGPPVPGMQYPDPEPAGGDRPFAGDAAYRGPEIGFLNLREGLVRALTEAGLRWGGTDFGNQSGDIMHFHLPESEVR